jgi:hypothetical protein
MKSPSNGENTPKTTVVNVKHTKCDVFIYRGTPFGNPFDYMQLGITRTECIEMYRQWFYKKLNDPVFRDKVLTLKGKTLGCWCKPDACHGDVIVEYLEK